MSNRLDDALLLSHVPTALTRVLSQSCNDIKRSEKSPTHLYGESDRS
jgi:hypothetical protein